MNGKTDIHFEKLLKLKRKRNKETTIKLNKNTQKNYIFPIDINTYSGNRQHNK